MLILAAFLVRLAQALPSVIDLDTAPTGEGTAEELLATPPQLPVRLELNNLDLLEMIFFERATCVALRGDKVRGCHVYEWPCLWLAMSMRCDSWPCLLWPCLFVAQANKS